MKKVFIVAIVTLLSFTAKAQFTPSLVISAGLPVGDENDSSSFAVSGDIYFMKSLLDKFDVGVTTGFTNYFGKDYKIANIEFEGKNVSFLPLAGAVRFGLTEDFSFGADLGYAFGLTDGNNGGFYYKPVLGFNIGEISQLLLSYQGISAEGRTFNYVGLGFAFGW